MPAAAVIPAPIAYIKVVAVKKLVVGYLYGRSGPLFGCDSVTFLCIILGTCSSLHCEGAGPRAFTLRKSECFKQVDAVNTLAWYDRTGPLSSCGCLGEGKGEQGLLGAFVFNCQR